MELLVKKAKSGDAEAFIALMEENKQSMYKVARGFLRENAYFKTWMIRILINNCKDILRSRNRQVCMEEDREAGGETVYADEAGFRELIEPLGEQDRSIFTLYYVYGMKAREIASCMEMKESTVLSRLKRGREALREEWGESRKECVYEK